VPKPYDDRRAVRVVLDAEIATEVALALLGIADGRVLVNGAVLLAGRKRRVRAARHQDGRQRHQREFLERAHEGHITIRFCPAQLCCNAMTRS